MIWTDDSSRIGSSQDQPPVSLFAVKPPVKPQTKLNFKAELMTLSLALAIFNFAFAIVLSSMGFIR